MDTLHRVLRSFNTETKSASDHLTVFREFLSQLDRVSRENAQHDVKAARKRGGRKPRSKL